MLIVIAGLPGSGKSTMATDLARALNRAVLDYLSASEVG